MGMPELVRYWTADDVRALPDDGQRYECIDGVLLVTPAPRGLHQLAVGELFLLLSAYVRAEHAGELMMSPADIELEPDSLVQPDLYVHLVPRPQFAREGWASVRSLTLAIEVLSPSTARYDRGLKRRFYLRAPTDEYWIIDCEARVVERWRRGDERPEILTDELVWRPAGAGEALRVSLPEFFAALYGE